MNHVLRCHKLVYALLATDTANMMMWCSSSEHSLLKPKEEKQRCVMHIGIVTKMRKISNASLHLPADS
jgi:hypothetical protein